MVVHPREVEVMAVCLGKGKRWSCYSTLVNVEILAPCTKYLFLPSLCKHTQTECVLSCACAVLGDFEEKQVDQFGKLVENTLSDVNKMDGADPLLRHKLMDMVDDIEVSTRELRASKEEAATKDD